jgi:hypothetical protein
MFEIKIRAILRRDSSVIDSIQSYLDEYMPSSSNVEFDNLKKIFVFFFAILSLICLLFVFIEVRRRVMIMFNQMFMKFIKTFFNFANKNY